MDNIETIYNDTENYLLSLSENETPTDWKVTKLENKYGGDSEYKEEYLLENTLSGVEIKYGVPFVGVPVVEVGFMAIKWIVTNPQIIALAWNIIKKAL